MFHPRHRRSSMRASKCHARLNNKDKLRQQRRHNIENRYRRRCSGLFYTGYGAGWLIGSVVTGLIYEPVASGAGHIRHCCRLASLPLFDSERAAPSRGKRTLIGATVFAEWGRKAVGISERVRLN